MDTEELLNAIKQDNEQTRRHFDVVAESLRSDIGKVAEGVTANTARLDRVDARLDKVDTKLDRLEIGQLALGSRMERVELGVQGLHQDLKSFQEEASKEFKEVKSQIKISYTILDERVTRLESVVTDLQGRVEHLESRP